MGLFNKRNAVLLVVNLWAVGCGESGFTPTAKNQYPFAGKEAWIVQVENDDGSAGTTAGLFLADYRDSCSLLKQGKYVHNSTVLSLGLLEVSDFEGTPFWNDAPVAEGTFNFDGFQSGETPTVGTKAALGAFYRYNEQCGPDRSDSLTGGQIQIKTVHSSKAGQAATGHLSANVDGDDRLLDFDFEAQSCLVKLSSGIPSCVDRGPLGKEQAPAASP